LRGANDAGVHLHAPLREHFVLSKHNRGEASSAVDPDFAEALEEEDGGKRDSASRRAEHKTRQLCRQVQRALNLALAERGLDLGLEELYVDEVTPAAGYGRLLVHFVAPPSLSLPDVLASLGRMAPRLRAEVARAISRKHAPELSFIPAVRAGGSDG
jgi:ribosome-binding factor A